MPGLRRPPGTPVSGLEPCQPKVLVCDRQGQVRWANEVMRDLLGLPRRLTGANLKRLSGPNANHLAAALDAFQTHGNVRVRVDLVGPDGRVHPHELLALDGAPAPDAVQIILTGAAEGRPVPESADVGRQQAFLADACREVQIFAEAVAGYAELLVSNLQRPVQPLSRVHSRMRRLSAVVGDFAYFLKSAPEEGRTRLRDLDLEDVAEEAASTVYADALRKGHELVIDVAEDARVIRADRQPLRRLLTHLFAHAVKVTPAGGRITFSARAVHGSVQLTVSEGFEEETGSPGSPQPPLIRRETYWVDEAPEVALRVAEQLVEAQGGKVIRERDVKGGEAVTCVIPV